LDFEWDEDKRQQVIRERGVDILYAAQIFEGDVLTRIDDRKDTVKYARFRSDWSKASASWWCIPCGVKACGWSLPGKEVAMTARNIRRASLDEIRRMRERGELHHDPAAPEGEDLGKDFWARATLEPPRKSRSVHLKLDPDVFEFFRSQSGGKGHLTKMQKVLKAYADAHRR
jgi:uncharacterized protein (DUF4415 family)